MNLDAIAELERAHPGLELIFVESGGDNLAAAFSIPRKGGAGIMRSDLLVINKIDLAPHVGASLEVMDRDVRKMRGDRPFLFTNLKNGTGVVELTAWVRRQLETPEESRRTLATSSAGRVRHSQHAHTH